MTAKVLVIEEVSMLHGDYFDQVWDLYLPWACQASLLTFLL